MENPTNRLKESASHNDLKKRTPKKAWSKNSNPEENIIESISKIIAEIKKNIIKEEDINKIKKLQDEIKEAKQIIKDSIIEWKHLKTENGKDIYETEIDSKTYNLTTEPKLLRNFKFITDETLEKLKKIKYK